MVQCHTVLSNRTTPQWILEGDIKSCFDRISHTWLLSHIPMEKTILKKWLQAGYMDKSVLYPTEDGTPQGGILSPPTKLQTFFFGIVITRIWVDPKHDIDLVTSDFHPFDQRPDEVAFARPVGGLQPLVEFGGKVLQTANNQLQFPVQGGLLCQRLALLFQPGEPLTQAGKPRLELRLVDEALRITVDQAGHALTSLADLVFDRGQWRAFGARLRLQATPVFLRQPFRVGQQGTDFLPHGQVQQISPYLGILAETLAPKAVGICAQTAVIGIGTRLAFAGTRTQAFPVEGIATVLALEQALQQIQSAPARVLPGMALVLLQLLLHGREHRGLHERGDGNRNPVLWGDIPDGDGPAWLHGPIALGPQPGPQRLQAGLAKRRAALIGWIFQDAPYHTAIPHGLAGAGHLACLGQPTADLANRQAVLADPGKDFADHTGLVRDDLIAGLSAPLVLGDIAVPIGGAAEHVDGPDLGRMALATPMPLNDLGALILGNHPLYLQQEVVFGALPQGTIEEHNLHPGASELIDQEDLIGIFAGQAIWRVHIEPVNTPRRDHIAQALQRRVHQCGPTIPFVKKLHRLEHGQTIGSHALAQRRHLTRNGMRLGVRLRRHTGVDRYLCGIHACCLLPTCCLCGAPSACWGARACGAGRRLMGTTRSYACATQTGLTRLGSNVRRTARIRRRPCPRRATLTSLCPRRGAVVRWHSLEWGTQKPIPIPGSQLCSRNTCRELYRQVSNFVGSVIGLPCGDPASVAC